MVSENISEEEGDNFNRENEKNKVTENRERRESLGRTVCIMLGFVVVS